MTEEDKSAFAKKHSYDVGVKASISWAPGDKPGAGSGYVLPENGSPPIKVSDAEMGQMFMLSQMMQVDPVRANKELASASTSVRAVAKEVFDMNIKTSELGLRVQTQNETARHNKVAESNDSARTGILGRSAEYRVPRSVSQETYTAMNAISVELDDPGTTPDRRKVLEAGYRRLEGVAANELGRALQRDRAGPGVLEKPPLDFKDFAANYGDTPVPGLGTTGKKRVLKDLTIDQQYQQYQQFIQSTRGASDGAGAPVVAPPPRNAGGPAKPEGTWAETPAKPEGTWAETPRNAAPRTPQERTNDEMLRRRPDLLLSYNGFGFDNRYIFLRAQENGIEGVELSTKTLQGIEGTFDLVLANILANTLVDLAPLIAPKVAKRLVLAGVLVPQADEVKAAYVAAGLTHALDETIGEWIRIEFDRR
jgi:hypothetical protein